MTVTELQTQIHYVNTRVSALANATISVGDYKYSARSNDFLGWAVCDGRAFAVADMPQLYEILGNSFGGDSNYFSLPDFRGRTLGGVGTSSNLSSRMLGDVVGDETHTLIETELPSHTHATNATGGSIGLITADGNATAVNVDSSSTEPNLYRAPQALTVNSTGGNLPHNIMQPTVFAGNMFIFTGVEIPVVMYG